MPIYAPSDTLAALGDGLLKNCESRSLFQSRFADPQAKDDKDHTPRKDWFHAFLKRNPQGASSLDWLPSNSEQLYARLMSRMMIDMSGGVMENANVLLDRYGLPYIPGSAVKGCARRMALQALHDWIQAQETPGSEERPAEDDACAPCCKDFKTPAEMLATIARIFGWVEKDWEAGKKEDGLFCSDFGWACGEEHASIWTDASQRLANAFDWELSAEQPWKKLPNFAGTIAFLEAKPNTDPGLELDVLTPHHKMYYSPEPDKSKERKKWEEWNAYRSAPDTEDPEPIFFPVVKPQKDNEHFIFPLVPLRHHTKGALEHAKLWLSHGLELFGIGAKTAAGYGWFQDVTDEINQEKKRQLCLNGLDIEFSGFESWTDEQKDEAILRLSERKEDCRLWSESSSPLFTAVNAYAQTQSIPLV